MRGVRRQAAILAALVAVASASLLLGSTLAGRRAPRLILWTWEQRLYARRGGR